MVKTHRGNEIYFKKATTENRKGVDYITLYGEEQAKIEKQKRSDANKKVWENRSQDKRDTISLAISKGTKGKIPWNKGKGKKYLSMVMFLNL